jgi:pyridoxal 5'-phosphate synthase pdxS subunit
MGNGRSPLKSNDPDPDRTEARGDSALSTPVDPDRLRDSEWTNTTMTETQNQLGTGLAQMLKGGVIMDVVDEEQARIAEAAGASAVMALERVPADIRAQGGVARMSDPDLIDSIIGAVSIPVMAKARIGHFVEAQILETLGVDYIDESEVLSPADYVNHIDKSVFQVPFVCGATNLGEALRRITEGASMIRSKGEAGTGDVSEAMRHLRTINSEIRALTAKSEDELYVAAKEIAAPYHLVKQVASLGRLPVVTFVAGGIATPGRCGDDDAARRRRSVRRIRHLQIRRPGGPGESHRRGHHPLR